MAIQQFISVEWLRATYHYDPETGIFTSRRSGERVGSMNDRGYMRLRIKGHWCKLHRLAWFYVTGTWPGEQIDHINGNRADNRWANLREADAFLNTQNLKKANRDSRSGYLGVKQTRSGRYAARLTAYRKVYHLGVFDTAEEAYAAYMEAKQVLHAPAVSTQKLPTTALKRFRQAGCLPAGGPRPTTQLDLFATHSPR